MRPFRLEFVDATSTAFTSTGYTTISLAKTHRAVRLVVTEDANVYIGPATATPVVTAILPAMTPEYFSVGPGDNIIIEGVSASGTANVVPLTN